MTAESLDKDDFAVGIKALTVSERGIDSIFYGDWQPHPVFLLVPAQVVVARYVERPTLTLDVQKIKVFQINAVSYRKAERRVSRNQLTLDEKPPF
jgi:hypothetical protein